MCDVTHSYVWRDSFMCDVTHSYVWFDSFICVIWLSFMTVMWITRKNFNFVHIGMSHVTHTNESRHIFEWVTSHIQINVTHPQMLRFCSHWNESRHTYERVMWVTAHLHNWYVQYDSFMSATWCTWLVYIVTWPICVSHSRMFRFCPHRNESHHTYKRVTWVKCQCACAVTHNIRWYYEFSFTLWVASHLHTSRVVSHGILTRESCHTYMWVTVVSHGTLTRESCHTYMWVTAMTNAYVCPDSFLCVPWLIHMCAMTHSYVWHE